MRRLGIIAYAVIILVISAVGLCFTVVNKGSYKNSLYYRFTRQRFAWIVSDPFPKHAIEAGWAKAAIAPVNMAASGDASLPEKGDSIQTRALILDNGTTRAVLITVDLQKVPPAVAQALGNRLPKLGFPWKNVYMAATYSQPGVGGWAKDRISQRTLGPYNEQLINQLTEAVVNVVVLAQKNVATTQIGSATVDLNDQQGAAGAGDELKNDPVHLLQLRKLTGETALVFARNSLVIPPDKAAGASAINVLSRLTQRIEKQTHSFAMGMVGAIEFSENPAVRANRSTNEDQQIDQIVSQIASVIGHQGLRTDSTLVVQTAPLIQNDPQIRISQSWRLKPWLAKTLYGDHPAELKALRIGQTVFVGCPGGLSSQLATDLQGLPAVSNRKLILTSYNGGDIGQIAPDRFYYAKQSPYAIDQMNRFGPHTAEFFEDMTQSLVSSLY
ncbi:neutral/alkaline non-lysosomal ceramidase N-terminal domain-containing protein [Fibrella sp. ES10-3-2-2]